MLWYMNEDRELLQKTFREFAQTKVRAHVAAMEEKDADAKQLIIEAGQQGFLGLAMPEEVGGLGEDYINWGLLMEELGKESPCVAMLTMIVQLFNRIMLTPGACTPEQIEKWVTPSIMGDIVIALCSNEASGGSFFDGYQTVAKKEGDEWTINGSKVFITQVDVADVYMVVARTKDHFSFEDFTGIDIFMVPASTPGIKLGHIEKKVGLHGSHTGTIYFDNVKVKDSERLGSNLGLIAFANQELGAYGALALGACEAVLAKTVNYLKNREQYGASLWDAHEYMRYQCGEMDAKIKNLRNAVYGHMANLNAGNRDGMEASALKAESMKILEEISSTCIGLMGGTGEIYETGIERYYRDVKGMEHTCLSNKSAYAFISNTL